MFLTECSERIRFVILNVYKFLLLAASFYVPSILKMFFTVVLTSVNVFIVLVG